MKKIIPIVFLSFLLTACATDHVSPDKSNPVPPDRLFAFYSVDSNLGMLDVTRDSGFIGGGCYMGFYIDGKLSAKFDPGERSVFYVYPGEHIIGIGNPGGGGLCNIEKGYRRELATSISAGEVKNFRLTTRPGDGAAVEPSTL
ncbi:hypothetical protein [Pectobacterium fontis]|uniref:hypothetical protein n=1 Tax=Pectobacterium fontis TaxID=2558042 RepID=UPI0009077394|nr:hypothetical protein [Pectobacterium fontis]